MPPTTPTLATRRSLLRAAAVVAPVTVVAPSVIGMAAAAATSAPLRVKVRPKRAKKCRRSQVRVKGRCKPKKAPAPTATTPYTPPTGQPTSGQSATGAGGTSATATPTPTPQPVTPGPLLSPADRHLATRFSYGIDAALAAQVRTAGGAAAWFADQLSAPGTSDPATDGLQAWWPSLSRSAPDLWSRQVNGVEGGWEVMNDYQRYLLVRRMRSTRPVLDVMTEFWENHFNVPVSDDTAFLYRVSYGETIRSRALGRFDDLLIAAVTHPAMLLFLNAAVSTKDHPNENLGRELLELHTVGRGPYGEPDVKASARILTGYHVDMWRTWAVSYQQGDHAVGPVSVMSFTDANASSDGRATTTAYLRYLARHPATAQRIARKLAVKFVGDDPTQRLVDALASTYLASDTAIAPVLRVLVASPEFAAAALAKVRDPGEDLVATYKALGVTVSAPSAARPGESAERAILWQCGNLGATPHSWPRPDGAPSDNGSWSSPARLLASLDLHYTMSGGWWPSTGLTRRQPVDWLPAASVTVRDLVEHLSIQMLQLTTPPGLLEACCLSVDVTPDEVVSASHPVVRWLFPRLITTVLDSPHHLKR